MKKKNETRVFKWKTTKQLNIYCKSSCEEKKKSEFNGYKYVGGGFTIRVLEREKKQVKGQKVDKARKRER